MCGFFNVPHWTYKHGRYCETGPTVKYSPYPRRLESLTICWCNYKGSTFYSVIFKTQSVGLAGVKLTTSRITARYSTNWATIKICQNYLATWIYQSKGLMCQLLWTMGASSHLIRPSFQSRFSLIRNSYLLSGTNEFCLQTGWSGRPVLGSCKFQSLPFSFSDGRPSSSFNSF